MVLPQELVGGEEVREERKCQVCGIELWNHGTFLYIKCLEGEIERLKKENLILLQSFRGRSGELIN